MNTPSTRVSLLFRLRDPRDHDAWMEFVDLYEPVILRLVQRQGLQESDARDVMQDLFLAIGQSIDRWDPAKEAGSFRGWLRRVSRNLVINWVKHRDRRVAGSGGSGFQAMLEMIPAADGPESAEFDHELRRTLFLRAAERVRHEFHCSTWQAFWETGVMGVSVADAANKLGMTVGATRVAKCRVLARLRDAVTEMEKTS